MGEEHGLYPSNYQHPIKDALIIGFSSVVGSLIPLLPFFLVSDVSYGMVASFILTIAVLFVTGVVKAKVTIGDWLRSGLEITLVGIGAAVLGYLVGYLLRMI